ncbi:transposase [Streptomyces sp. NPDC005917]|uniref:transposase n=1 Tax=unclassified Streptomyces TaxID=2593676 RepID=UPI00340F345A
MSRNAWAMREGLQKPVLQPMQGFASFLRQNLDAVTAGLTLPWSSGVVGGHVNRVKTLKRAMYGRASFELLRTRILIGQQA